MLINTDPRLLDDGYVRSGYAKDKRAFREIIQRQYEDTDQRLKKYREPDHDHLKDKAARTGRPLTHTELIRIVSQLTKKVWVEDSINNPGAVGFYMVGKDGNKKYVVAFDKGWLPEHTYINVDRADLPYNSPWTLVEAKRNGAPNPEQTMKRGWREVLLRLMQLGVLNRRQVRKFFGDATLRQAGERWRRLTQHLPN